MRKITLISITILLILSSCNTSKKIVRTNEKLLIGKWEIVNMEMDLVNDNKKSAENKAIILDLIKDSYMNFSSDKSVEIHLYKNSYNGTWKINSTADNLIIKSTEKQDVFKIITLSERNFIISTGTGQDDIKISLKK